MKKNVSIQILILTGVLLGFNTTYAQQLVVVQKNRMYLPLRLEKSQSHDAWFGKDKIKHFLASAFITGFGYLIIHEPFDASENPSVYGGSALSFGVGLSKEMYDWKSKKGQASYRDLVADVFGIAFAVFILKVT